MLVLSRRIGEKIFIGKDREITVCVLDVQGRGIGAQIRLGIDAPTDIPIDREEVVARRDKKSYMAPPINPYGNK